MVNLQGEGKEAKNENTQQSTLRRIQKRQFFRTAQVPSPMAPQTSHTIALQQHEQVDEVQQHVFARKLWLWWWSVWCVA